MLLEGFGDPRSIGYAWRSRRPNSPDATWSRQFAKADISLISKALGHSGTQVTERYARVVDREIVEMLDQLPDITPLQRIEA